MKVVRTAEDRSRMIRYPSETANFFATLEIGEEGFLPHTSYEPKAILSYGNGSTSV
jgi:hypothetical protein